MLTVLAAVVGLFVGMVALLILVALAVETAWAILRRLGVNV